MIEGSSQPGEAALSWGRLFFVWLFLVTSAQAADKPNIVVIMADDHAQWAVGAYGLETIQTPNIDHIASVGVLFENAMSPAPVCSPARASFYTGKMPSQHGVHDFLSELPEFDAGWLDGEVLLSERLSDAGYRTGLFGKWHATTDSRAPQPGFDRWLSYDSYQRGWRNQYLHTGAVVFSNDGETVIHDGVQAEFLTAEAIRFIEETRDKPFFVSLNFVEPHAPFAGLPERLVELYRGLAGDIVRAGASSDLPDRGNTIVPSNHDEQLAQYLAAITLIDEQVGSVLDTLSQLDLLDNTLVVYTSDHGLLMGQYGLYGKTNATNPPNFYEETIRIPLAILAPEEIARGRQTRGEIVDLLDLHATILDYATGDAGSLGPGRSMRPLLAGERNVDWRTLQFAERGNARMVTDGRWKLVRYYQKDPAAAPIEHWYDLVHPFRESVSVDGPNDALNRRFGRALDGFFARFETRTHSGVLIWDQPMPNARMQDDLSQ